MAKNKKISFLFFILSCIIVMKFLPKLYFKVNQSRIQIETDLGRLDTYTNLKYEKKADLEILNQELNQKILKSNYEDLIRRLYAMEGLDIKIIDLNQGSKSFIRKDGLEKIERKLHLSLDLIDSQAIKNIQSFLNTSEFIELIDFDYKRDAYGHRLELRLLVDEYKVDSYDE